MVNSAEYEGNVLVEAINKELLKQYSSTINRAEKVGTLLGQAQMNQLRDIVLGIATDLQKELSKATNFRKKSSVPGKEAITGFLRNWLGKYYKGGALKKFSKFLEEFKIGMSQVVEFIDASLPSDASDSRYTDRPIYEIIPMVSANIEESQLREVIINAFEFSDPEWNDALDEVAKAILNMSREALSLINDEIKQIDGSVDNTIAQIDNVVATEIPQTAAQAAPQSIPQETAPTDPNGLSAALSQLSNDEVDSIVRSANRKRRKLSR